ncbi:hypothetical protein EDB80DRAFT_708779 [Ilyonectria destructans]|nr:hypothetical protein EDB80DRAFT_708779 [Ilyonectria destructans]
MDIFTTTIEAIKLAALLVNKTKTAVKAEKTVQNLFTALKESRERIEDLKGLFSSLSPNEDVQSLVNRTYTKIPEILDGYDSVVEDIQQYFKDKKLKSSFQRGFDRSWKGVKWVLDESWIIGRIDELRNQDGRLDEALVVFNTYQGLTTAEAQQHVLEGLKKIEIGTDGTRFIKALEQLPVQLEPSAREKLNNLKDSPPSWVLDEEPFRAWQKASLSEDTPWLWILGEAGAGKSHVATFLAQHLLSLDLDDQMPVEDGDEQLRKLPTVGVAIHYCSFKEEDSQNSDQILACLLRQLLHQLWEVAPRQAGNHVKALENLTQPARSLHQREPAHSLLGTVSRSFDRVYILVDGLDELPELIYRDMIPKLRKLNSPEARVILTSREAFRHHAEHMQANIINANNNKTSIRNFVCNKLKSIAAGDESYMFMGSSLLSERLNTEEKLGKLGDRIIEIANRNFLCADLLIKQFYTLGPEGVDDALDNPIDGLDELIKRVMERIGENKTGRQALLWIIHTVGSGLQLVQLQHALAFSRYSKNVDLANFRKDALIKSTSYFLNIGSSSDFVSIHKAVKDYCNNPRNAGTHFENPHGLIAKTCLGCMEKSGEDAGTLDQWKRAVEASPFLEYAASNWGWHLKQADERLAAEPFPNLDVMKLLERDRFLDSATIAIQRQLKELGFWKDSMWYKLDTEVPPLSALHILAFFNLPLAAEKWINRGNAVEGFEDPSWDQAEYTPLYMASRLGHHEMVETLIALGADPNRQNGPEGTSAFQAAVRAGHDKVVDVMLETASLNKKQNMISREDRLGRLPLMDACGSINHQGNLKIVQRILKAMKSMRNKHDLLLNRAAHSQHTALHEAATANEPDIISALLNFPGGQDLLELRNRDNSTALLVAAWACWNGASSAVRRLLDAEADLSAKNLSGESAVHVAARHEGHMVLTRTDGFRFLLEKSDLTSQDNCGQTPLHLACRGGRPYHVAAMGSKLDEHRGLLFIQDNEGRTPIATAATLPDSNDPEDRWKRAFQGKMQCIEHLIPRIGDDLSSQDAERLLSVLLQHTQVAPFSLLLKHSAKARELFAHGSTPLRKAVQTGDAEIVKAAIESYARAELTKGGTQLEDQSLLIEATKLGFYPVAKVLIDYGADINGSAADGRDTLDWCTELCNPEVVEAIWARDPNILMPSETNRNVLDLASARNPVRLLWKQKHLIPDTIPKEIECLHSERRGSGVVIGDQGTATTSRFLETQYGVAFLGVHAGTYLESDPIPSSAKVPMSKISVSVTGKDQGWSDHQNKYPWDKGTLNGSETWFQIAIKRDGNIVKELEVARNLLNVGGWTTYNTNWNVDSGPQPDAPQTPGPSQRVQPAEAESFVNALRRGDRLCIVLRANYQGWQCWIQDATIRVYYED